MITSESTCFGGLTLDGLLYASTPSTTELAKHGPPVNKRALIERSGSADRTAIERPDRSIKSPFPFKRVGPLLFISNGNSNRLKEWTYGRRTFYRFWHESLDIQHIHFLTAKGVPAPPPPAGRTAPRTPAPTAAPPLPAPAGARSPPLRAPASGATPPAGAPPHPLVPRGPPALPPRWPPTVIGPPPAGLPAVLPHPLVPRGPLALPTR
eukprot:8871087-Pyramimonas_sp.AAC.2